MSVVGAGSESCAEEVDALPETSFLEIADTMRDEGEHDRECADVMTR